MTPSPPAVAWAATLLLIGAVVTAAMLSEPPDTPREPALTLLLPERPAASSASPDNAALGDATAPVPPVQLAPADPALIEEGDYGPLPKIGPEGRKPWQVYRRPFAVSDRPRISVIVTGIGLSTTASRSAMEALPPDVTFAVLSYADDAAAWVRQLRADGHETLLAVPMEPELRTDDPGPRALTVAAGEGNLDLLEWHLARATGYVGLLSHMGGAFLGSEPAVRNLSSSLRDRGLLAVDASTGGSSILPRIAEETGVPVAAVGGIVDAEPSRSAIERSLAYIEETARAQGAALAVAHPYPVTIETLALWAEGLKDRGFDLAPVSALMTLPTEAAGDSTGVGQPEGGR